MQKNGWTESTQSDIDSYSDEDCKTWSEWGSIPDLNTDMLSFSEIFGLSPMLPTEYSAADTDKYACQYKHCQ